MTVWNLPKLRPEALSVWRRNVLVWRKLIGPALLMNFGEPAIYLLGLGFGLGGFVGSMSGLSYMSFLASGTIASSAMTTVSFEGMYSVFTRMVPQRTYEAILATPLEVDDIVAGEMLWCATKGLSSGVSILVVAALLGAVHGWQSLWAIPAIFLTGLCFAGPAIIMSALGSSYDFFNYYFVLVVTPMFMLSGVFYPLDTLPAVMQSLMHILPLTHAVELIRPLVTGQPLTEPFTNIAVLAAYALATFYLAVALVRRRMLI